MIKQDKLEKWGKAIKDVTNVVDSVEEAEMFSYLLAYTIQQGWKEKPKKKEKTTHIAFNVVLDEKGNIESVWKTCDIPEPDCNGCMFEEWCNKVRRFIMKTRREVKGVES